MDSLRIGDIVTRKSYGGDIHFKIADISSRSNGSRSYLLKGILFRIIADSDEDDLIWKSTEQAQRELLQNLSFTGIHQNSRGGFLPIPAFRRPEGRAGTILHIDSSSEFTDMCKKYYNDARLKVYTHVIPESEQPGRIRSLLASTKADILIVTGHDGLKKNATKLNSVDSYRNSRYYIQSVVEARKYQPDKDKLCIFSGACQSYFEGIMDAGANFASSPGRILIHALDPAKVGDRMALTDSRIYVTPDQIAKLTQSGIKGIGGIKSRGHYVVK